ncbi:CpsB/CapC family capsule biosynthesis tyrosine phosphatase [Anaerocolumna sp. MB42-C2]|uniref:CpsB/CapC family capsule biosynthesis tyrosine phosphatase n=1 Tax=Anaerocolumna sp. MB42-C2 TaxID=3070997 RepID=UPI0027E09D5C|nr:CpsB/CapC family capsule biosynthesis tyrosine phosphatase [Anaerocolumna sp. MB42-C2]WMJ85797.1 CpsB/CapC family capsule biosynthesis tyrosine phosphatase [Anaerocolumna sp. MB42-C2]
MEDGYIDIHDHILPGVDDGAQSMEQTLRMFKIAYEEGIRTVIATPHFYTGSKIPSMAELRDCLIRVTEELNKVLPQMSLYLGGEIYYSQKCISLLINKQIPALADSRYLLVEFQVMAEYQYIKKAVQEILINGYIPILAHIERYESLVKELGQVQELVNMGAYVQINAQSIMGDNGFTYKRITRKLLKNNLVHIIATDSHNDGEKAPRVKKCAAYLTKKYGEAYTNDLLQENQKKIIRNQYI